MIDSFDIVVRRIKALKGLRYDKEVAEALGTTPGAFHIYRRRDTLPVSLLRDFAVRENIAPYWLLTGQEAPSCDDEIANMIVEGLRGAVDKLQTMAPLTPWEQRFVTALRKLDPDRCRRLLGMIEGLAEEEG